MKNTFKIIFIILPISVIFGCDSSETSRFERNPRKTMILTYAYNITEDDTEIVAHGTGIIPAHPSRLKEPYPTAKQMEAAIGKADTSLMQTISDFNEEQSKVKLHTLYWWEKDSHWDVERLKKKGYRELVIARFDNDGKLRMLEILDMSSCSTIGRTSEEWTWAGN